MRIWLLGGFRASVGPRIVEEQAWRLRKAASLVKLLALSPGHRLHREQAMEALWPDLGRKAASNNLRQALHAARKALDPAAGSRYLASEDESLALCPDGRLWVDVEAFDEAARTARRARDPAAYRAALDLYTGDLLPEDRYEEWTEGRREEFWQLYLGLLIELAGLYEEHEEYGLAIEALRKATAIEPTFEEAYAALMRLHALSGRPEQALAQYQRLRDALSKALGTQPGATTRRLRDEIAAGRLPPTPPAGPPQEDLPDADRHNLPAPRTSFVGREREMVGVKRTLAMTRLLTLTGAGGSGKTRLALEVTRDLISAYPDGVWLVELASLSEDELVPQAVAGALEVPERPGQPLTNTLIDALRAKKMLLILDNCEHLVDAVARLVDVLLESCPRLRVLATSREALDVAGEVRWPVPPLSVPDPRRPPTVSQLEGSESARLFTDRAADKRPSFALTSENMRAVAEICRRLDGVPLAIELAAARVGALSVEQISERLGDSLGLLTAGSRTATSRQRTLRGALDWSHELLSEAERVVFRRLSVFAGGWTLEAAEAVAVGEGVEEGDVLDLLSRLVEKSLVVAEAGRARYRMLEPVRQYAQKKLEGSAEVEAVARRHTQFFLALAEEAEPELWGPKEAAWLQRLEVEHDNMRAALSWALEREEAELGLRLAGALQPFWQARGYYGEARRWLEEALAKDGRASAAARAKALVMVGWLANDQTDLHRMITAAEEGLELSAVAQIERSRVSSFLELLGQAAKKQGDYERATKLLEESLELSRESGDRRRIVSCLLSLGQVFGNRNDFEQATQLYEAGLALSREWGYGIMIAGHSMNLGYALLLQGDYERAVALNEEAVALLREHGRRGDQEYALYNLGWAALLQGDHERAKSSYEESMELCQELGNKSIASESLEGLACVCGAEGEAERAARLFGAAGALRETVGYQQPSRDRALREPYLAAARSQLDEASWEVAFAEGRAMTLEEAVEYALSAEEPATPAPPAREQSLADAQPPSLTRREEEIATLVAQGLTNRQIASELSISEHTAATHVARILKKLGLSSRSRLTAWVTERALLSSDLD